MNRRQLLASFLATPVALRFAPFQKPAASELAKLGYFLFMSPMTPGQLSYDDLDIQLGLAPAWAQSTTRWYMPAGYPTKVQLRALNGRDFRG